MKRLAQRQAVRPSIGTPGTKMYPARADSDDIRSSKTPGRSRAEPPRFEFSAAEA